MTRKPIAFLTTDNLENFVVYDEWIKPPLGEFGWAVVDVSWRSQTVCWDDFAAVIIRSPWDYHFATEDFLNVIETIERSNTTLLNSAAIVRWNIDKQYLRQLEHAGAATVPTLWKRSPQLFDLLNAIEKFETVEIIVKPTIGAGARDTFRVTKDSAVGFDTSIYQDRMAMLQPFLTSIIHQGEWSLFYFNGIYSHAVLKIPKAGDFRVQEEFGSHLEAFQPTAEMFRIAQQSLAAIPEPTLYARVDLVLLGGGELAVIELELIEPSLYFPYDDFSPKRFAAAIDQRVGSASIERRFFQR